MIKREAFFLDTPGGARFAIMTRPAAEPKGGWLYIHPFAEEMNKSRRMAALAAQAFARDGWMVLQVDLKGCGDSAGDFGDATWEDWVADVSAAWEWLAAHGPQVRGIWTLRAGSLLAADWLERSGETPPLIFWQPVRRGEQHLTQFLRLKAANEMLNADQATGGVSILRSELAAGRPVEIAGYTLAPELARGLSEARLRLPPRYPSPVAVFEIVSGGRTEPSPAIAALVRPWRETNGAATLEAVPGTAFWQTVEIETTPALIEASRLVLEGAAA